IGGCPTGEARITGGYDLLAGHVIHTAGPRWKGGGRGEEGLLRSCYRSSLDLAAEHGLHTIAFPSISTGAYDYPVERAAPVAVGVVREWIATHPGTLDLVRFVLFGEREFATYRNLLRDE
ncbi:MAG TPA: macro domain-containing protein, partial [Actinomycetota bacterium]|nr:macro domain-containing protein [Actinomycetota bacterium]